MQFLGQDEPVGEITKQDVVAFRHSLVGQVSAKTVNHDLKALKMLFKTAKNMAHHIFQLESEMNLRDEFVWLFCDSCRCVFTLQSRDLSTSPKDQQRWRGGQRGARKIADRTE